MAKQFTMPGEKRTLDYLKEGAAYVCNPANTVREFRSLPKLAKWIFAFLLAGLAVYFVLVGDYSFWGWLAIAGLVFSATNLVLVDNGKLTSYPWGILCSICSVIGAIHYAMWGDTAYYIIIVFPFMIYGIAVWRRLAEQQGEDDTTRALSVPRKDIWKYIVLFLVSYVAMYAISVAANGSIPLVDSLILSCGVVGQIFLSKSYKQQWIIWLAQDVIAVVAWSIRYGIVLSIGEMSTYALSMIVMWGIFLVNAVYGCWQWYHTDGSGSGGHNSNGNSGDANSVKPNGNLEAKLANAKHSKRNCAEHAEHDMMRAEEKMASDAAKEDTGGDQDHERHATAD